MSSVLCRFMSRPIVYCCVRHQRLARHRHRYSTADNDEEQEAIHIPRDKIPVKFSRSSGPGGQNVNKLNTKADIRFHLETADWLPPATKERAMKLFKTRINKQGELIVTSQKYRSQLQNVEDAFGKLEDMIEEASEVPRGPSGLTLKRIKLLKRKAERKRLTDKKYHSLKKDDRQITDVDET